MMTMIGVGASMMIALAAVADRRRTRRRNIEQVGFMPWQLIAVLATFVALFAFALAIVSPA
jgi:hypothetical protein